MTLWQQEAGFRSAVEITNELQALADDVAELTAQLQPHDPFDDGGTDGAAA